MKLTDYEIHGASGRDVKVRLLFDDDTYSDQTLALPPEVIAATLTDYIHEYAAAYIRGKDAEPQDIQLP